MDLESERSAHGSVETQRTVSCANDNNSIKTNGSCADDANELGISDNNDGESHETGDHSLAMKSPAGVSPPMKKGYGLKKWRRIKRDFVQDDGPSVNTSKVLKRGLSGSVNPARPMADIRQNSEASIGSANGLKSVGVLDGFATRASSSDSRLAVGSPFSAGTDSENSEDRSSKSSTAASAPKLRYDLPATTGNVRDRNRMKNLSGKSGGHPTQRVQAVKSRAETSKKPRGEKVKIEKENSRSSMESDSRSSNFVFMQGPFVATSNGRQSARSMNYDGENSDDAHTSEEQCEEEVQTGYTEENVGSVNDLSHDDLAADLSWDAKEEKSENHRPSTVRDPLVESLISLQSVQDALEKEVKKLGDFREDAISLHDTSIADENVPGDSTLTDPEFHGPSSSNKVRSEKIGDDSSNSLEMQVLSLTQNVQHLKTKLKEMSAMLEVKELRVAELEATLNSSKPLKVNSESTIELQPEQYRGMETELEGLLRQKIEAEVEYLALSRVVKKLRVAAGDCQILTEKREALVEQQAQMLKFQEAEIKARKLQKQAKELEECCGDLLRKEDILKMQNGICKVTSCFAIQFMLLVLVIWLFALQSSSHPGRIVPT